MMLIPIALGYAATFTLAYPSSIDTSRQNKPVSEIQYPEVEPVQSHTQEFYHAGDGVSTNLLETLDAIRSKIDPSPVEVINSFFLSYAEAGVNGTWNMAVNQIKALLDNLTAIITQDDSHVFPLETKMELHALFTAFTDLLILTPAITSQASRAIETNPTNLESPPDPSSIPLSRNASDFLLTEGSGFFFIPILALMNLEMIKKIPESGPQSYQMEIDKYKAELELIRTSQLKTSAPLPFSAEQCAKGMPEVMAEIARNPVVANEFFKSAAFRGLLSILASPTKGLIVMAWDTGTAGVARMTHAELKKWATMANGDASSCKNVTMLSGGGGTGH
jgi:hypothetical protein